MKMNDTIDNVKPVHSGGLSLSLSLPLPLPPPSQPHLCQLLEASFWGWGVQGSKITALRERETVGLTVIMSSPGAI